MDVFHVFEGRVPASALNRARLSETELDARVRRHDAAHREMLIGALLAAVLGAVLLSPWVGEFRLGITVLSVSALCAAVYGLAPDSPESPLARHPLLTQWALDNARNCTAAAQWRDLALTQRRALRRFDAFAMRELACLSRQPPFNPALDELHTPTPSRRSAP